MPLTGRNFYRVIALGSDGSSFHSETRELTFEGEVHEVKVYPNPLPKNRSMLIELRQSAPAPASAALTDLQGKVHAEVFFGGHFAHDMAQIDANRLAAGVYLLKVSGKNWQETQRIVVE
ncbi:MAG: T9SS C-terminal target domain-containing protein [Bacteroidetes bacterium]|nr:MAG: T9SS C-terminal target domain-containing protein [Bacteroidota bacterium]